MHRREEALTRAVMKLEHRLLDDGVRVRPTARELFLMAMPPRTKGWLARAGVQRAASGL